MEDMKIYIRQELKSVIKEDDSEFTLDDISNYGIARAQSGIFTVTLWRNIKGAKDVVRSVKIKLDTDINNLVLFINTLETLLKDEVASVNYKDRIKKKKDEDSDNPFSKN